MYRPTLPPKDGYVEQLIDGVATYVKVVTQEDKENEQRDLLLAQLQEDNKLLRAQLTATIQSNQTLEDCLVEMASVVYA